MMRTLFPCALLVLPTLSLGCAGGGTSGGSLIEVAGDRDQVVGVPFEIYATLKNNLGAKELEVTLSSGDAIAEPPPEVALQTVDPLEGEKIPIPLVCQAEGEGLVIVSVRPLGRTTRLDSVDFEVNCILAGESGPTETGPPTGSTTDPTTDPTTDQTTDPTDDTTTTGSETDGSSTGGETDTGEPIDDAEFLAIDYTERMYGLIVGGDPAVLPGGQLTVPATDLRVETLAGERIVIGNYEIAAEVGIVHGRFTPELDEVEPLPVPGATLLVDNAFNGDEFVIAGSGLWLFDGTTVVETESSAVAAVACEGMTCVAAASAGGFLRSSDGGQNWMTTETERYVSLLEVGQGRFVGWDGFNNEMVVSDDGGSTWVGSAFPAPLGPLTLGYGDGRFVAPASADVYSSSDGVEWELGTQPFDFGLTNIAHSPSSGQWAGFTGGDGAFAVSDDGAVWTAVPGVQGKTIFRSIAGL